MRPPQFAGEDLVNSGHIALLDTASMRPPQFAGEDGGGALVELDHAFALQ